MVSVLIWALGGCASSNEPIVIDLDGESTITTTFDVDGQREVIVRVGDAIVVEGWADGGTLEISDEQIAAGGSASWWAPHTASGDETFVVSAHGSVTLAVHARGVPAPQAIVKRSLAWLDAALLDDASVISFAKVMAAISDDGHGGPLLAQWFGAFAAGPGAGRATFARFLDDVATAQGSPTNWNLAGLPFRVTGIHNRIDLARDGHCGELRVSVASTDGVFAPVHVIFLFRQVAADDDVTPDGVAHCRGTARRWARLSALDGAALKAAAGDVIARGFVRDRFLMAESVELSISPWQWRQWQPVDGELVNPLLFQTVDVARVNVPGELRDAFLDEVATNADAIAARSWTVPARFRSAVIDVAPNEKAPLVDLGEGGRPELPRAIGMIGCPRCHTDNADFVHTNTERTPSPFYERELDARAARLDSLAIDGWPASVPFGPLQPL